VHYRVISADDHVVETPGTFVDRVPGALKQRVPRVLPGPDGGEGWSWDGKPPAQTFALDTMATRGRGLKFEQLPKGQWDGAAHLKDLEQDGIDAAVMYPGLGGRVYGIADTEAKLACFRAYNDWLMDEFCAVDPQRLIAMPMIPTDDGPEAMLAEAERVLAKGAKGVFVSYTAKTVLYDPVFDGLWKLVSDAHAVASLHNFGGGTTPTVFPEGVEPSNVRLATTITSFFSAIGPLTQMILTGVFQRFPKLKFLAAEVNVGWVPYWAQQMHMSLYRPKMKGGNWYPHVPTETPEEHIGRNIYFTVLDDACGFEAMKHDDRLAAATMWSIDYPHGVTLYGQTQQHIRELTAGMDEQRKYDILAGNCVRAFNLN